MIGERSNYGVILRLWHPLPGAEDLNLPYSGLPSCAFHVGAPGAEKLAEAEISDVADVPASYGTGSHH